LSSIEGLNEELSNNEDTDQQAEIEVDGDTATERESQNEGLHKDL